MVSRRTGHGRIHGRDQTERMHFPYASGRGNAIRRSDRVDKGNTDSDEKYMRIYADPYWDSRWFYPGVQTWDQHRRFCGKCTWDRICSKSRETSWRTELRSIEVRDTIRDTHLWSWGIAESGVWRRSQDAGTFTGSDHQRICRICGRKSDTGTLGG